MDQILLPYRGTYSATVNILVTFSPTKVFPYILWKNTEKGFEKSGILEAVKMAQKRSCKMKTGSMKNDKICCKTILPVIKPFKVRK